ncbi:hypothetical protein L6452_44144 [Arctium lappa]|uniref:Uncharacterized protein n=1 Tax=Arctium lappa TaxID=4217 RepID=A0ACB8XFP0_ARCLA|nr:hypothetical protein L6452_44144 [Arctium lappa]
MIEYPFVHPCENARRHDLRKFNYSCVTRSFVKVAMRKVIRANMHTGVEELRPVYTSTGLAMPSPKSGYVSSIEMGSMSPLTLGSTPAMSPPSSPMWQNKVSHLSPPTLQPLPFPFKSGI